MFTGIVTAVGRVKASRREPGAGSRPSGVALTIGAPFRGLKRGESIAVNGACLTVEKVVKGGFTVHAIATTLEVYPPPRCVLTDQRPLERGGDGVNREAALHHLLHREARTVDGDALTALETAEWRRNREGQSGGTAAGCRPPQALLDAALSGDYSGKHSLRSKTSNVSAPNALRSTGIQRGAWSMSTSRTSGKAGMPPFPSQNGAWIQ